MWSIACMRRVDWLCSLACFVVVLLTRSAAADARDLERAMARARARAAVIDGDEAVHAIDHLRSVLTGITEDDAAGNTTLMAARAAAQTLAYFEAPVAAAKHALTQLESRRGSRSDAAAASGPVRLQDAV